MKKVYASADRSQIEIVSQLLREEGIESCVLNEKNAFVIDIPPFFSGHPELWVRDADESRAQALVARFRSGELRDERQVAPWRCSECGETIEGQFTQCWNCTVDEPRDDPESQCLECGYLLRDLPERRCPECGTEF